MPTRTFARLDQDKQERVLRAAIEQFQAEGYARATIEDIAKRAGVAKGSLYQYFEDKQELFTHCASWTMERFMAMVDQETPLRDMDVYDYFLTATRARWELFLREPLLIGFSIDLMAGRHGSAGEPAIRAVRQVGDDYELRLIRNGKAHGTIRADLDDEVLLIFVQGVTERFSTRLLELSGNMTALPDDAHLGELERLLHHMVSLLRQGMGQ